MRKRIASQWSDCRIVVFYRFAPQWVASLLPPGREARVFRDYALGGMALIRRRAWRASLWPKRSVAVSSLRHFLGTQRTRHSRVHVKTLVLRCDTSSRLRSMLRHSWYFDQRQHHAQFRIREDWEAIQVCCNSDDQRMRMVLSARPHRCLPESSLFRSPEQVRYLLQEELRRLQLIPYPSGRNSVVAPGSQVRLIPLRVDHLESSYFDDPQRFPAGTAEFDSAFWVRSEEVVWQTTGRLCYDVAPA